MSLSPGTRLGHYDVTALIGSGGMGEVYRARDTKLNRDVALKVVAREAVRQMVPPPVRIVSCAGDQSIALVEREFPLCGRLSILLARRE